LGKSYEASIKQLQKDLSESKREVTRVEANMAEALAAKNAEIEALLSSMDAVKRQAALSEGNLASMQVPLCQFIEVCLGIFYLLSCNSCFHLNYLLCDLLSSCRTIYLMNNEGSYLLLGILRCSLYTFIYQQFLDYE